MVWRQDASVAKHPTMNLQSTSPPSFKESILLTEATVEKMFRTLISDPKRDEEIFEKAEDLLEDELRPESPLRHRLSVELEELRTLAAKS